ncbi:reverse transcriptase [Senna tora]|uniref:Reverse transcriptase n=1 Tax=Senna tora TaxID=362788 RepID=A0A834XBN2_9FABA|nr:reverse transcriptase [Senna tora]
MLQLLDFGGKVWRVVARFTARLGVRSLRLKEMRLGFKEFEPFNNALLGKQAGRIMMHPNDLWARVLKVRPFLSEKEIDAIMCLPVPDFEVHDERVWIPVMKGVYNVKSGYFLAKRALEVNVVSRDVSKASSSFVIPEGLWGAVWKLKVAEKVKHFIWRLCSNFLPTLIPLANNCLKINCDASFDKTTDLVGIGIIIIDWFGKLVDGRSVRMKACSINVAESLALKEALTTVMELDLKDFSINVIARICLLNWPSIMRPRRDANKVADWLAKNALRRMRSMNWDSVPPSSLAFLLDSDVSSSRTGIG